MGLRVVSKPNKIELLTRPLLSRAPVAPPASGWRSVARLTPTAPPSRHASGASVRTPVSWTTPAASTPSARSWTPCPSGPWSASARRATRETPPSSAPQSRPVLPARVSFSTRERSVSAHQVKMGQCCQPKFYYVCEKNP